MQIESTFASIEHVYDSLEMLHAEEGLPFSKAGFGFRPPNGFPNLTCNKLYSRVVEGINYSNETSDLPSVESHIQSLHMCRKERNMVQTKRMHVHLCDCGLETHEVLGNHLVPVFVDSGGMYDAQQVFRRLVYQKDNSYTALILGHIKCQDFQHALDLFQQTYETSESPSSDRFLALLRACTGLKSLEEGRSIHTAVIKHGYEKHAYIGNMLVNMYGKCDSILEAEKVFDTLLVRDVVSWNTLVAGYAEHNLNEAALICVEQMQLDGVLPDAVTFVCSLNACSSMRATDRGRKLHATIVAEGFESNIFVGSSLVDMYVKCDLLLEAQQVFDELPVRDTILWNTLIGGYAEHDMGEDVLTSFRQMKSAGVSPDAVTYLCTLKVCGSMKALEIGWKMHTEIIKLGYERESSVGNSLVDVYAKCGSFTEAQYMLDKLPTHNVISWTALIAGYAEYGLCEEALNCWKEMQLDGLLPNAVTFICILKACTVGRHISKGREVHAEIVKEGFERESFLGSTLVDMYCKFGSVVEAQDIFDELPTRDTVSWTALIAGYGKCGLFEKAWEMFNQVQVRDVVLWNAMISGYAEYGLAVGALSCFEQMQMERVYPNVVTWNTLISGCAEQEESEAAFLLYAQMLGQGNMPDSATFLNVLRACHSTSALETGKKVYTQLNHADMFDATKLINILINMYSKCGNMVSAQEIFDATFRKDVTSWNALMTGYANQGEILVVIKLFDRMREDGVQPNDITFLSILTVCSHAGCLEKGLFYFQSMSRDYGITPTIKHYNCMLDLLCRASQLDKAVAIVEKMTCHPDVVTWITLLGACQTMGNVDLGRWAFSHAVRLDENQASPYVSMSNVSSI